LNPPQPPYRPLFPHDPNSKDGNETPLSERLDDLYHSRREVEDLPTTEFPIAMLMALDKLSQANGSNVGEEAPAIAAENSEDIALSSVETSPPVNDRKSHLAVTDLSGHLKRVAAYAKLLALKLGMDEKEAGFIKQISPMHDIGKWAIPESILHKPSALTPDEWVIMKTHTSMGYEMLKDSKLDVLRMGALVAIQHQEKFDGTGYPKGLKGEEIHIYSRITTVADVFDALGSERTYKQAWPVEDIIQYFQNGRGSHFDPVLVDLLLANLDEFLAIRL
jgi:HD-GYP domain-containing protein (c-di-GMP phosphodiesterase class II)